MFLRRVEICLQGARMLMSAKSTILYMLTKKSDLLSLSDSIPSAQQNLGAHRKFHICLYFTLQVL